MRWLRRAMAVAAERWYELRSTPPGGSFSVYQAATYKNSKDNYWMGSVAMDHNGNMALGFSADNSTSSGSQHLANRPSVHRQVE